METVNCEHKVVRDEEAELRTLAIQLAVKILKTHALLTADREALSALGLILQGTRP